MYWVEKMHHNHLIAFYVETSLLPEKYVIIWCESDKRFDIYKDKDPDGRIHESLDPIQFFAKYRTFIKTSEYYTMFMAQILGRKDE